jgi:hypothetical protein
MIIYEILKLLKRNISLLWNIINDYSGLLIKSSYIFKNASVISIILRNMNNNKYNNQIDEIYNHQVKTKKKQSVFIVIVNKSK